MSFDVDSFDDSSWGDDSVVAVDINDFINETKVAPEAQKKINKDISKIREEISEELCVYGRFENGSVDLSAYMEKIATKKVFESKSGTTQVGLKFSPIEGNSAQRTSSYVSLNRDTLENRGIRYKAKRTLAHRNN